MRDFGLLTQLTTEAEKGRAIKKELIKMGYKIGEEYSVIKQHWMPRANPLCDFHYLQGTLKK